MDSADGHSSSLSSTSSSRGHPTPRPALRWKYIPQCRSTRTGPKRDQPAFTTSPEERLRPSRRERPPGADPVLELRTEKSGRSAQDDGGTTRPTGERASPADSSPEADPQHPSRFDDQIRAVQRSSVHVRFDVTGVVFSGLLRALQSDRRESGRLRSVQSSPDTIQRDPRLGTRGH